MRLSIIPALVFSTLLIFPISQVVAQELHPKLTADGITYVNGGVGYDEAEAFEQAAQHYPLRLMFSEGECGRALTTVDVQINDQAKKTVFSLTNAGPQLLVDLPAGQYKVIAQYQHKEQGARFSLNSSSNKKVVLNWKNCIEEDSLELPEKHDE